MEGAPGTLYEGEKFQLLFKFSSRYPFDSPQVSESSSTVFTNSLLSPYFYLRSNAKDTVLSSLLNKPSTATLSVPLVK